MGFGISARNAFLARECPSIAGGYDRRELRDTIAGDGLRRISECQPDEQYPASVTPRQIFQGLLEIRCQPSLIKNHCYRQTGLQNTFQAEIAAGKHRIETNGHVNSPVFVLMSP